MHAKWKKKAFDLFDMYKKLYSEQRHEAETKYIYTKMMTKRDSPQARKPTYGKTCPEV